MLIIEYKLKKIVTVTIFFSYLSRDDLRILCTFAG